MTIKDENANRLHGSSAPPASNVEEEFVVSGEAFAATGDANGIPFATAVPIDDNVPPSYNPQYSGTVPHSSYATTATGSGPPPGAMGITSSSQSQYPPFATDNGAAAPGGPPGGSGTSATAAAVPPPGVPPGGRWVLLQGPGANTWTVCTILSVIFCVFTCLPCGLWAFLCPCDERRAYLVNGKLFDEDGGMIGSAHSRRYR